MYLDLDQIERIAKQRQESGGRVTASPEVILAMVDRIRALESRASQDGGGEAAAFEAWAESEGYDLMLAKPADAALGAIFHDEATDGAWNAWQARAALAGREGGK